MAEGPQPYPVVYDAPSGSLQYVFQSGQVTIPEASVNAITALTGQVTATGPGSVVATVSNAAVIAKVLTGYMSGAGTISASDSILSAIQKLNGNQGNYLPLTGGTLSGPLITGSGTQPTVTSDIVVSDSTQSALSMTGTSVDASTSTEGVLMYLMHNDSNNRQFGFIDSAAGIGGSESAIRFVLTSTGPSIDCYTSDSSGSGTIPLTLGNTTNGVIISGTAKIPATTNQLLLGTTNTVTISATAPSTSRTYTIPDAGASANVVLDHGAYTIAGQITFSLPQIQPLNTNASATGTLSPVANVKEYHYTLTGNLIINGPSSPLYDGQEVIFRIQQSSGGSNTVAFATGSNNFSFGTTFTSFTMTTTANAYDYVGAKWNSVASRWNIVSISQGF